MKGENKRRVNIRYVQCVSKLYNTHHLDGRYTLQQKPNLSIAVIGHRKVDYTVFPLTVAKMSTFLCQEVVFFCSILLNDLHALESKGKHAVDHLAVGVIQLLSATWLHFQSFPLLYTGREG